MGALLSVGCYLSSTEQSHQKLFLFSLILKKRKEKRIIPPTISVVFPARHFKQLVLSEGQRQDVFRPPAEATTDHDFSTFIRILLELIKLRLNIFFLSNYFEKKGNVRFILESKYE